MPHTIAVPVRYTQVKELPSYYLNLSYLNSLSAFGFDVLLLTPGCSPSFYERPLSATVFSLPEDGISIREFTVRSCFRTQFLPCRIRMNWIFSVSVFFHGRINLYLESAGDFR